MTNPLDAAISAALRPLTRGFCQVTGRPNTTLAIGCNAAGIALIEAMTVWTLIRAENGWDVAMAIFILIFAPMLGFQYHVIYRMVADDLARGGIDDDTVPTSVLALAVLLRNRVFWGVYAVISIVFDVVRFLALDVINIGSVGLIVWIVGQYVITHFEGRKKSWFVRAKAKVKVALSHLGDWLPQPRPIPIPVEGYR